MAFKMKSQDTRTKSKLKSRRGAIALAENLGGVLDDPLCVRNPLSANFSPFYARTKRLHLTTHSQYA